MGIGITPLPQSFEIRQVILERLLTVTHQVDAMQILFLQQADDILDMGI
jgi:hypothetical protein